MSKLETLNENRDEILDALKECTEKAMRSHGRVKYSIYCWEDGEVRVLEDVAGGTLELHAEDDDQALYLMTTVDVGVGYDPREWFLGYDDGDLDDDDDDPDEYEEDELIDRIMELTDWEQKLDEIEEEIYYEVA